MKDNNVKIIGGKWKRKNISFNEAKGLRPTLGRVRETLFNWLGQDLNNKKCLDLFAGTAALCLSQLLKSAWVILNKYA
jgi:16S rRNA (guanine966-N2)-methyltransferase